MKNIDGSDRSAYGENNEDDLHTEQFSSLIDLFDSIGVVEKGIEQVYDYLLHHEKVDDVKELERALGLKDKRIYKVCQQLKRLGLVQLYDRPMKIRLIDPVRAWETLIQQKIDEIRRKAAEQIEFCQSSFEKMKKAYRLQEPPTRQPVEFISLIGDVDIETVLGAVLPEIESFTAKGIAYMYPDEYYDKLIKVMNDPSGDDFKALESIMEKISTAKIYVLLSRSYYEQNLEILDTLVSSFKKSEKLLVYIPDIEVRIKDKEFGNFIVKDGKVLLQPSIGPSARLIGFYSSNYAEDSHGLVGIFKNKFRDMYNRAEVLRKPDDLSDLEWKIMKFALSI